jgi:DNA-binding transcriptional LysR family regulator
MEWGKNLDTLEDMRMFVRSVELGSLSGVARERGVTQPTVSKAVSGLEKKLGVRLLDRNTTSLAPTVQGVRFYERARQVLEEFDDAVADAQGLNERPAGLLRVNAPLAIGQLLLAPLSRDFLRRYPDVQVELIFNDRMVDLVEEGVDVALRLGGALPQDAVARRIAVSPRHMVAAPSYLAAHAPLREPQDLAQHDYVRFAWLAGGDRVELHNGARTVAVETLGRFRVNNALSIREALLAGDGVGLCPAWLVHDLVASGALLRVLPDWYGAPQELDLLSPSRRYQPLRARLFIDFVADALSALACFRAADAALTPAAARSYP